MATVGFEKSPPSFPNPHLFPLKAFMLFIRLQCKLINGYKKFEGQEMGSGVLPGGAV